MSSFRWPKIGATRPPTAIGELPNLEGGCGLNGRSGLRTSMCGSLGYFLAKRGATTAAMNRLGPGGAGGVRTLFGSAVTGLERTAVGAGAII
mmetsp:Transcript_38501/g.90892  ORF Transcript_38501/g.90892 Transcript_38501/m.90892 type:complete len:92 (-) Transcript_38501:2824-3099(-)